MQRFYSSMIAAIVVMVATAANAAVTAGTVTALDTTKHTVTLDDGTVYTTSVTTDLTRIKLGYTIQVTFIMSGATNNVTALEILSPAQPSGY